jgi:peptidoglycan-associated lipoprotein
MTKRYTLILFLAAGLAAGAACKKKPPKTAPEAAPPPPPAVEQPMPTPPAPPPPSKTSGVMSEDLATINARGYLRDAYFDLNKSELREDARTALAADAQWFKQYSSIQVLVEGHCDERGTEEYNLSLGDRRASAVKEYLGSLGVDAGRVRTVSYGKDRPFCSEHDENCWQQNRRGHFVVTAK